MEVLLVIVLHLDFLLKIYYLRLVLDHRFLEQEIVDGRTGTNFFLQLMTCVLLKANVFYELLLLLNSRFIVSGLAETTETLLAHPS